MSGDRPCDRLAHTAPPVRHGGRTADCVTVRDVRNGRQVAACVEIAASQMARLGGLIGRDLLEWGSALLIPNCKQVHTFFMRFSIDVIALGPLGEVVGIAHELRPFRVSAYWRRASCVLECPAGTMSDLDVRVGDVLEFGTEGG